MVNYGNFELILNDEVNEAFVHFSFEQDVEFSVNELLIMLIEHGLVKLGYLHDHEIIR